MKLQNVFSLAFLATGLMASSSFAETMVKVTLIDKMGTADLSKPLGLGMGMKADMSTAKMGININPRWQLPAKCALMSPILPAIWFTK